VGSQAERIRLAPSLRAGRAGPGKLQLLWELEQALAEIGGMRAVTLQPAAGAQGELTGISWFGRIHRSRGDMDRTEVLVPDSAHGTNPATVLDGGFQDSFNSVRSGRRSGHRRLPGGAGSATRAVMITNLRRLACSSRE